MQLQTFCRSASDAWTSEPDSALDSEQTMVLLFGGSSLADSPAPLERIVGRFPRSLVIGCSTSGEIFGADVLDDSLVAAVVRFDRTRLRSACAPICAESSFEAGARIGRALGAPDLRAVLVFSDGLKVNGSSLVRGINSSVDGSVVVSGGLAGDGDRFNRTWIIDRNGARSGYASAIGLYGEALRIGHGSRGGWDVFGIERTVTRSAANVLYELDGLPALGLYKEYLGERASGLPATGLLFPLSLRSPADEEKRLVRTILAVNEADQSLTFAGDVPQGYYAQLMSANFDRLIEGAGDAATGAAASLGNAGDSLAIAISCVGRRLVLGEQCEEEVEAARDAYAANTQQVGFYSYGEISPYAGGHCDLHNQTMTITTLSEA